MKPNSTSRPEANEEEWVSKTRKKQQMNDLQDLGFELTKLSNDTLKKIGLPEDLLLAIFAYHKINSNSALKRQVQYIGRLMREIDPEPIINYLAQLKGENTLHNAYLQRLEQLRDRLINDDQTLTQLINQYPQFDIANLRTLIRNARKEKEANKPPKAYRSLFQYLKAELKITDSF